MQTTPRIQRILYGTTRRDVKYTHSCGWFKSISGESQNLESVKEIIVQASNDTGACYGVAKCAEVVFERGKMVKGEGFQMLNERMKTIDPD